MSSQCNFVIFTLFLLDNAITQESNEIFDSFSKLTVKRDVSESHKRKKMKERKIKIETMKRKKRRKYKLSRHLYETSFNATSIPKYSNVSAVSLHISKSLSADSLLRKRLLFHRKHKKRKLHNRNNSFVYKSTGSTTYSNSSDIPRKRNSRDYPFMYGESSKHIVYTSSFLSKFPQFNQYNRKGIPFNPINFEKDGVRNPDASPIGKILESDQRNRLYLNRKDAMSQNSFSQNQTSLIRQSMYSPQLNLLYRKMKPSQKELPLVVRDSMITINTNYLNPMTSQRAGVKKSGIPIVYEQQTHPVNNSLIQTNTIQPLSEFPTDDFSHHFEKTNDNNLNNDDLNMMVKDEAKEDVDVPFPINIQLPSPKAVKNDVLSNPPIQIKHYFADSGKSSTPTPTDSKLLPVVKHKVQPSYHPKEQLDSYHKFFLQSKNSFNTVSGSVNGSKVNTVHDDGRNVDEVIDRKKTAHSAMTGIKANKSDSGERILDSTINVNNTQEDDVNVPYRNRDAVPLPSHSDVQKSIFDIRKIQKEVVSYVKNIPIVNLHHISDKPIKFNKKNKEMVASKLGKCFQNVFFMHNSFQHCTFNSIFIILHFHSKIN